MERGRLGAGGPLAAAAFVWAPSGKAVDQLPEFLTGTNHFPSPALAACSDITDAEERWVKVSFLALSCVPN